MNIIFDTGQLESLKQKYIILPLDTINFNNGPTQTAYCIVDKIPFEDMPDVERLTRLHRDLLAGYKGRHWDYCIETIGHLRGAFGGEIDSFYDSLLNRITEYKVNDPSDEWDGSINRG